MRCSRRAPPACEQANQPHAALEVWTSVLNAGDWLCVMNNILHASTLLFIIPGSHLFAGGSPSFGDVARIANMARNHGHSAAAIAANKFGAENFKDEIAFPVNLGVNYADAGMWQDAIKWWRDCFARLANVFVARDPAPRALTIRI
jgi:hypothetical protein